MKEKEKKYPFTHDFQMKILALMLRDRTFLSIHRGVVEPNFFDNSIALKLCKLIFSYYDKYLIIPTQESVGELISDQVDEKALNILVDFLYKVDLSDGEYVKERAIQFSKRQAIKRALLLSKELITDGDFDGIRTLIDKALLVGSGEEDLGNSYFSSVNTRLALLSDDSIRERRVATLLTELDDILEGGISPGELNIMMAPPGKGKSIFLVNMAFAALWQRKNVVFVTLEMSPEKIALRLDSRFTGIPLSDIKNKTGEVKEKLKLFEERTGNLIIKKYPSAMATVNDIRNYIKSLRRIKNFVPDLLIVDYLDILNAGGSMGGENPYIAQGEITKALRGLASEQNFCLWTATQGNRSSASKEVLTSIDKADSWRVVADADILLGLMRTLEDIKNNDGRISLAKVRNADTSKTVINLAMNYSKMYIGNLHGEI